MKKIKIKYSLIILMIVFGFSGFLMEFFVIYFSIVLHEIGHLLVVKLSKGNIYNFELNLTGARIDINIDNITSKISKLFIDISRNNSKYFNYYC